MVGNTRCLICCGIAQRKLEVTQRAIATSHQRATCGYPCCCRSRTLMLRAIISASHEPLRHALPVVSSLPKRILGWANECVLQTREASDSNLGLNFSALATYTALQGTATGKHSLDSCSAPSSNSSTKQRPFNTAAQSYSKMATAQTIQQRSSLDLALANPVYQGDWTWQK